MLKRLSLLFVSLLLLATLEEAFHHHDDGADHDDCPTCVAAHHQQSEPGFSAPVSAIQRHFTETAYARPVLTVVTRNLVSPANDRAPPI